MIDVYAIVQRNERMHVLSVTVMGNGGFIAIQGFEAARNPKEREGSKDEK